MATAHRTGSASFTFTSITGMTSPFLLAWPLELITDHEVSHPEQRYIWRSMDGSGRNVVTVAGAKAHKLGVIRRDDQPDRLREFLRHAMDGDLVALAYKPSTGASGVAVDIDAVNEQSFVSIRPDRSGIGWEVAIRLVVAEASIVNLL